jgi:hypothetical protein
MNSFIKGMGTFDLQPTQKKRKTARKEKSDVQKKYVLAWNRVSRAFRITGNHMRSAFLESNVREIYPSKMVRITATDKKIVDLFNDVSVKFMPNGKVFLITRDRNKAISLRGISLQLMNNGEIRVFDKNELKKRMG